ncbi:MAG: ABC transporter substrate-binding protein [Pseudomonadota bacterium]
MNAAAENKRRNVPRQEAPRTARVTGWRWLTRVLRIRALGRTLISASFSSAMLFSSMLSSTEAFAETVPEVKKRAALPQAVRVEALAASAEDPHVLIEGTLDELRNFASVAREYAEADPERYFVEIQAVLDPVLNFKRFARNVMAAPYKTATVEQRQRFTETFKRGLIQTYSLALTQFDEGEIVVLEPSQDAGAVKRQRVRTEIRTPSGDAYPVVYSLALEKDNRWRIYNIVANGVNLGLTFRNQFKSAWDSNNRDLDRTIDAWASIVSESEPTPTSS